MKNNSSAIQQNFVNICWTQTQSTKWFRIVVLIIGGSLLLTLSAKIQVPFWPYKYVYKNDTLEVRRLRNARGSSKFGFRHVEKWTFGKIGR